MECGERGLFESVRRLGPLSGRVTLQQPGTVSSAPDWTARLCPEQSHRPPNGI